MIVRNFLDFTDTIIITLFINSLSLEDQNSMIPSHSESRRLTRPVLLARALSFLLPSGCGFLFSFVRYVRLTNTGLGGAKDSNPKFKCTLYTNAVALLPVENTNGY